MLEDEFRKKFNVRMCEKCCATCRHGRDLCDDGAYNCLHPLIREEGESILTSAESVCDAWEGCRGNG